MFSAQEQEKLRNGQDLDTEAAPESKGIDIIYNPENEYWMAGDKEGNKLMHSRSLSEVLGWRLLYNPDGNIVGQWEETTETVYKYLLPSPASPVGSFPTPDAAAVAAYHTTPYDPIALCSVERTRHAIQPNVYKEGRRSAAFYFNRYYVESELLPGCEESPPNASVVVEVELAVEVSPRWQGRITQEGIRHEARDFVRSAIEDNERRCEPANVLRCRLSDVKIQRPQENKA